MLRLIYISAVSDDDFVPHDFFLILKKIKEVNRHERNHRNPESQKKRKGVWGFPQSAEQTKRSKLFSEKKFFGDAGKPVRSFLPSRAQTLPRI